MVVLNKQGSQGVSEYMAVIIKGKFQKFIGRRD